MTRWVGWVVGGLAVIVIAVAILASAGPTAPVGGAAQAPQAPDISNLTAREQFGRLTERIELAIASGDTATLVQFFPMAEAAFANLSDADRDVDARLHLSLLRARVGHAASAVAQVDSIEAVAPNHLFADYLRAIIADFQGDVATASAARNAFREHFSQQMATDRPEYRVHREMLEQFLASIPPSGP